MSEIETREDFDRLAAGDFRPGDYIGHREGWARGAQGVIQREVSRGRGSHLVRYWVVLAPDGKEYVIRFTDAVARGIG
jgi:hypothetical protein